MKEALHLEPSGNHGHYASRCGRYEVLVRRCGADDKWQARAYWYGHLVNCLSAGNEGSARLQIAQWLAVHRSRMLPKVASFELWAEHHYELNLAAHPFPRDRRNLVRDAIASTGDGNLALHFDFDERALHDHVGWNISIVLWRGYDEWVPDFSQAPTPHTLVALVPHKRVRRRVGAIVFRRATDAHRLALVDGRPATTLWIRGPKRRRWGFHCQQGWVDAEDFVAAHDGGEIGRGCGE